MQSLGKPLCCDVVALMSAVQWGSLKKVKSVVEGLEEDEIRKTVVNANCGPMFVTPLQLAAENSDRTDSVKIVQFLLKTGAQADRCDKIGRTPLHHAATRGGTDTVQALLAAGASPNSRYTVMPWANVTCGRAPDQFDCGEGAACPREATAANSLPLPECWGRTPLHQAVKGGHVSCVWALLEYGANVNALDEKGLSPLLLAGAGITADDKFAVARYEKIVELLVGKGADVNIVNEDVKCSPLHYSVSIGSVASTRILLDAGAALELPEMLGETVLHVAAATGNTDVLGLLLQLDSTKCLINTCDVVGCTPLHKAAYGGYRECLTKLINGGGDLAAETDSGLTVIDIIYSYIPQPVNYLTKIFDSKIIPNRATINDRGFKIRLDFEILAPTNSCRQTAIVSLLAEESKIIQHPLIEAFIYLKWRKMRQIFLLLFVIYVCFVFSFSSYALVLVHPDWELLSKNNWSCWLLVVTGFILFLNSCVELLLLGQSCFSHFEPWLNFICSLYAIVLSLFTTLIVGDTRKPEQKLIIKCLTHIASIVVLLCWGRLMFLLARFPTCGYYGLMFMTVLKNVLKVLMTFVCLVIGFVLCFCIQFADKSNFSNPWYSLVKTTIMMAGEFEYSDLFDDKSGFLLITSRFVFLLFVLLGTVVLMNLMVGLAVSDIQVLQTDGHLKRLKKQAEFMSQLEKLTMHRVLQKCYVGRALKHKHHLPTRIIIEVGVTATNTKDTRLSFCLLESVIGVALKNKKIKEDKIKGMKVQKLRVKRDGVPDTETDTPKTIEVTTNRLTSDGLPSKPENDLYNDIRHIKCMLQRIIDNYDEDNDENDNNDNDDDNKHENTRDMNSNVDAVLRRMSQYSRKYGKESIYRSNKQQKSVPV